MSNISGEGTLNGQIFGVTDVIDYDNLTNRPKINNKVVEGAHNGRYYDLTESEIINWLDYAALPEETKKNGKIYYIRNVEQYIEKTISNVPIASFNDGSPYPLVSLIIDIIPDQEGSGTPSPGNIRPLRGWNYIDIMVKGANVWDEEWEQGGLANATGAPFAATDRIRSKNFSPCLGSVNYYGKAPSNYMSIFWYDRDKTYINWDSASNRVLTPPINARYFKIVLSNGVQTYNNDISINYPSTDTSYHPYNSESTTATIDLGQKVYGGKYNSQTGKLLITDGYIASYNGETLPSTWISDRDEYAPNTSPSTGAEVVYKLSAPIEVTRSPIVIIILSETNNIWIDAGNINELKYLVQTGGTENQIRTNDEIFARA